MKVIGGIAMILTIIGGLNWGLVGIGAFAGGNWNVVNLILGSVPTVEWIVYILVGVSALIIAFAHATGKCGMKE